MKLNLLESLESRRLLSACASNTNVTVHADLQTRYAAKLNTSVTGYTPAQIRSAYGFDDIKFNGVVGDGSGQTIALVDAYNDPNIKADLAVFDTKFGIAAPPAFSIVSQTGGSKLPKTDAGWAQETSLDVEWAHAIAPGAKLVLVESTTDSLVNLVKAVNYARTISGVSVVSMSWGSSEFNGQTSYDKYFKTPSGHTGVTFVAAAGDEGVEGGAEWPASSPNVISVGGTTLHLNSDNSISSEAVWSDTSGGTSDIEGTPGFQSSLGVSGRTTADVSYNADPNTGFATYDSLAYQGESGWSETGGTSAGTPQWGALVAIANQGRTLNGSGTLDGATGTLPALYNIYASSTTYAADFNDITAGSNASNVGGGNFGGGPFGGGHHHGAGHDHGGRRNSPFDITAEASVRRSATTSTAALSTTSAVVGYDVPTGLGTPKAGSLVASLVSAGVNHASRTAAPAKVTHAVKAHRSVQVARPQPTTSTNAVQAFGQLAAPRNSAIAPASAQATRIIQPNDALSSTTSGAIFNAALSSNPVSSLLIVSDNLAGLVGEPTLSVSDRLLPTAQSVSTSAAAAAAAEIHAILGDSVITAAFNTTKARAGSDDDVPLFSYTHIDARATFQDAITAFTEECASLPKAAVAPQHSNARAWALTALIVVAEAAILARSKKSPRVIRSDFKPSN